jgi:hypothetical protein
MSRKTLRGASFKKVEDLAKAINDFIIAYGRLQSLLSGAKER